MKQHLLYPLTLLLSIFLFISSCQKKNEVSNNYTEQIISKAQEWYSQNNKTSIPVLWDQAVISIDNSRIIVPLDWKAKVDNGSISFRKLIIYRDKQHNITKGEIIEVIPAFGYPKANPFDYNWKKFSGSFGVYDLGLTFLYGQHVEHGAIKYNATFEQYRNKAEFDKIPKREYCWWVQSTSVGGDGTFTVVHTKRCMNVPDNNGGGDPGQQQPVNCKIDPDNPDPDQCTGGSGGTEPDPATEVINSLKDSCKKRLVDRIINENIQSQVLDSFRRVFNSTRPYNVKYHNGADFVQYSNGDPLLDTTASIEGIFQTSMALGIPTIDIFINDRLLVNASQEYIAGVILHEMVHGLMHLDGWHYSTHHNKMALEGFPKKIGDIVNQLFPNLLTHPEVAENLQWVGLQETAFYSLKTDSMNPTNAQWRNWIELTGVVYREGSVGTPCQH